MATAAAAPGATDGLSTTIHRSDTPRRTLLSAGWCLEDPTFITAISSSSSTTAVDATTIHFPTPVHHQTTTTAATAPTSLRPATGIRPTQIPRATATVLQTTNGRHRRGSARRVCMIDARSRIDIPAVIAAVILFEAVADGRGFIRFSFHFSRMRRGIVHQEAKGMRGSQRLGRRCCPATTR